VDDRAREARHSAHPAGGNAAVGPSNRLLLGTGQPFDIAQTTTDAAREAIREKIRHPARQKCSQA